LLSHTLAEKRNIYPAPRSTASHRNTATARMSTDPKYDSFDFPATNPESGTGHPGHTTPEQDEKVVQLRKELEEEGFTERLDTLTMVYLSLPLDGDEMRLLTGHNSFDF
jgi:hypothetical protein